VDGGPDIAATITATITASTDSPNGFRNASSFPNRSRNLSRNNRSRKRFPNRFRLADAALRPSWIWGPRPRKLWNAFGEDARRAAGPDRNLDRFPNRLPNPNRFNPSRKRSLNSDYGPNRSEAGDAALRTRA